MAIISHDLDLKGRKKNGSKTFVLKNPFAVESLSDRSVAW